MALDPSSTSLRLMASEAFDDFTQWVQGWLNPGQSVVAEPLSEIQGIDPRFMPRVPMRADAIDVHTLAILGARGFKHGKLITGETHPELFRAWEELNRRAGLKKPPQLILTESDVPNAVSLNTGEVMITTGLLKLCDFREVLAVLSHELGHKTSEHVKPRMQAHWLLGGLGMLAGNYFGHWGGVGKLIDHATPNPGMIRRALSWVSDVGVKPSSLFATQVYMGIGAAIGAITANHLTVRPTELEADRKGARISGDPQALISELRKFEKVEAEHPVRTAHAYVYSGYPSITKRVQELEKIATETTPNPVQADAPANQVHAVDAEQTRVGAPVVVHAAG